MLCSASRWARTSRNGCRIPAPAPCGWSSSPDTSPTRTSAEAIIELLERVDEIGLELEHRTQRIFVQLLHPSRGRLDRELLDVELGCHLAPLQRHRHGCTGQRAHAEWRDQEASVAVLHVIEVHLAAALLD